MRDFHEIFQFFDSLTPEQTASHVQAACILLEQDKGNETLRELLFGLAAMHTSKMVSEKYPEAAKMLISGGLFFLNEAMQKGGIEYVEGFVKQQFKRKAN